MRNTLTSVSTGLSLMANVSATEEQRHRNRALNQDVRAMVKQTIIAASSSGVTCTVGH